MTGASTIQIRQWNDSELLAFLNTNAIEYRLIGDHMFIIHTADGNVAAGLGDWLTLRSDGAVAVKRGDRARLAAANVLQMDAVD
jgi:hypothetical protein